MTAPHAGHSTLRMLSAALSLSAVAAAGYGAQAAPARSVSADPTLKRLERIVHERVDSERSTGIVAGMLLPDGSTRVVAYGDAGEGKRLDERSVFEIGSITKTFTGTLLAQMAQRGELRLTDPVASLLPPGVSVPSRGGRQITLQDLATHTSGLPRMPTNHQPEDPSNPDADYTVEQLYEFLDGYTLTRDPGSQYEYSNLGVGRLGHALALRARVSYEHLVRERILEPLHMPSSAITLTADMARHIATGHYTRGRIAPYIDLPTLAGAGALRSSVIDMLRFAEANLDDHGNPLGQAMAAAHLPRKRIDPEMQVGLNWHIRRVGDRDIVWHNGGTAGFSTFIGFDEERDSAIVVLSNTSATNVDDIGFHLLDERLALEPAPAKRRQIMLPSKVLARYVGVYDVEGTNVTITRSAQGLIAHAPGQGTVRLYAQTKTKFFLSVPDAQFFLGAVDADVTFQLDSEGTATGFVLRRDGQELPIKKIG
jgi:serine-type D-Ala-D-Ala carboxypeptidase/endopeptidase